MAVQKVAIAIHEGVQALDVAGPVDVFAEANGFIPASDAYEIVLVGPAERVVRASNGTRLVADLPFDVLCVMVNQQSFTKTANCWGVGNNARGTNTNRIVMAVRR